MASGDLVRVAVLEDEAVVLELAVTDAEVDEEAVELGVTDGVGLLDPVLLWVTGGLRQEREGRRAAASEGCAACVFE